MPRTLALINQKGGVGKTTTAATLAAAVAESGKRVLLVDMDPQANLSSTLLSDYHARIAAQTLFTTNDLLEQGLDPADVPDAITSTPWPGVDLIASEQALSNREAEGSTGIETRLKRALRGVPDGYDVIIIDCPPSLGRLTVNALVAAQEVILLSEPDAYSQNGLDQIAVTLATIRDAYDHDLKVLGLIVNGFEHTAESAMRTEQLRERFSDDLLLVIPKRSVIAAAAGSHQTVFTMNRGDAREVKALFRGLAGRLGLTDGKRPPAKVARKVVDLESASLATVGA